MAYPIFCLVVLVGLLVHLAPWGTALVTRPSLPIHHHQRLGLQLWHRGVRRAGRQRRQQQVQATIVTPLLILMTFLLWVEPLLCRVRQILMDRRKITTQRTLRVMDWLRHYEINNGYWRIIINNCYSSNNNNSMQVDQIHNNNNNSNNKCHNNKSNNNSSSSYNNKTICTDWPCKEDRTEGTSIWQRRTFQHCRVLLHRVITVQMYQ
mmetsp:Transcript_25143/g.28184  ORF Transcript_25143/g.28184 Transcript_25143/m.28184 type:complete len:207 (+) Transcript_25143:392-1012(+)